MYRWMQYLKIGLLGLVVVFFLGCAKKHAVLISTGNTIADDTKIHSEYWYDLFLQYKMLTESGFKDENIHVLYGNGIDFNTAHAGYNATTEFGHPITDTAVNKANIESVFNSLKNNIKSKDYLYIWWMGHGTGSGAGSCDLTMHISTTGETVTDTEFTNYLNNVSSYKKRNVAVMTCHSGGIVDNLNTAGSSTVVHASSTCPQASDSITSTCNSRVHAEFNYTFPNALREKDPCGTAIGADYNSDGYVSMSEAHQHNQATMTTSTPQMGDPDGIAPNTYIKKEEP